MPPKTEGLPGMVGMGTGISAAGAAGAAAEDKPSMEKVKSLLQEAMDMLDNLGAEDEMEESDIAGTIPPPGPRPPMNLRG